MDTSVVPIKVYIQDDDFFKEVRRLDVEKSVASDVEALKTVIQNAFPVLQCRRHLQFSLAWEDAEGDLISVTTDEELRLALEEFNQARMKEEEEGPPKRLKIHLQWGARFHLMRFSRTAVMAAASTVFSGLISDVFHRAVTSLIGYGGDY